MTLLSITGVMDKQTGHEFHLANNPCDLYITINIRVVVDSLSVYLVKRTLGKLLGKYHASPFSGCLFISAPKISRIIPYILF